MRIGIDVRYLSHGLVGGVHTYVAHFVPALIDLAVDHQIFLYADTKRPFELKSLPDRATVRYLPWRSPLSTVHNDLFMHRQMSLDRLDVVHFPANYGFGPSGGRTVITIHDALNILPLHEIVRGHPKAPRVMAMTFYLHWCTRLALRRADLLLTVSVHAQKEIARHGCLDPDRIVPVPHAPEPGLRRIENPAVLAEVRGRYGLRRPFVLADAVKNPKALVQAWRLLPAELRDGREIVFFCRQPELPAIVREAVAAGHARVAIRPPRRDLIALYSMADAFAFPSWIEGFGLPVLEAMACGSPVVASNRGAIPEVAGDAALLADVDDVATFAKHLGRVLGMPEEARRLRERGFARAAQYSWTNTAWRILESYERAVCAAPIRHR